MKQYFASFTFKGHPLRYHVTFLLNIKLIEGDMSDTDKIKILMWKKLISNHPYLENEKPTSVKIWSEKGTYTDGVFVCDGVEEVIF